MTQEPKQSTQTPEQPSGPWWQYGHMWMVLGGPLVVVIAAIVTVVIATRGADPVIARSTQLEVMPSVQGGSMQGKSMAPAQALRNHAATPDADLPSLDPK